MISIKCFNYTVFKVLLTIPLAPGLKVILDDSGPRTTTAGSMSISASLIAEKLVPPHNVPAVK